MVASTGSTASSSAATAPPVLEPERTGPTLGRVCGVAAVVVGFVVGLRPLGDNSWMTHLATGRLMLEDGIVRADPYTFTGAGEPWVVQSWLASLVYALIDGVAGLEGLRLFTAACTALLAGLLWRLSRPAGGPVARSLLVLVSVAIGSGLWSERPLLLGLVALAASLVVLEEDRDPRWIAVIAALWANVHGSFPLGPVLFAALAVGRRLDRQDPARELVALRWSVIGSVVGGVVNPYGPKLLLFPVQLLTRQSQLAEVVEWRSPTFDSTATRAFLILVALAVLGLVTRPRYRAAVPAVLFTAAALVSLRNVAVAAVVLVPVAGAALAAALASRPGFGADRRSPLHRTALAALVALAVVLTVVTVREPALQLEGYPVAAVDRMERLGWHEPGVRWGHPDVVGNYLDLRYGDEARVFVDDRFEFHDADVMADYVALVRARRDWRAVLDRHGIDVVLWEHDHPLAELLELDPGWDEAFTVDGWSVFCRSTGCPA
ncbi:MAG: hypothetical protein MUE34_14305 [Acidimicrobiales bacterium]|jgi:hypothetical protein|nr:hypothetical protein [Acidimicrobiales bacterium]